MLPAAAALAGSSPRARGTRPLGRDAGALLTVHPRVRGEHAGGGGGSGSAGGSSPRARGTRQAAAKPPQVARFIPACAGNTQRLQLAPDFHQRFIPACAGNTSPWRTAGRRAPVHPRVRGEHGPETAVSPGLDGSSPRARGTRPRWPAQLPSQPVHPRVRGEHISYLLFPKKVIGSSPRARGTRAGHAGDAGLQRFIPACAGNTRGEHPGGMGCTPPGVGSSPRARGTRRDASLGREDERFIPACAGNTELSTIGGPVTTVHPRVRGEHISICATLHPIHGSSPRARGTPPIAPRANRAVRFIPACAGNTSWSSVLISLSPVHPRVRGEHECDR